MGGSCEKECKQAWLVVQEGFGEAPNNGGDDDDDEVSSIFALKS